MVHFALALLVLSACSIDSARFNIAAFPRHQIDLDDNDPGNVSANALISQVEVAEKSQDKVAGDDACAKETCAVWESKEVFRISTGYPAQCSYCHHHIGETQCIQAVQKAEFKNEATRVKQNHLRAIARAEVLFAKIRDEYILPFKKSEEALLAKEAALEGIRMKYPKTKANLKLVRKALECHYFAKKLWRSQSRYELSDELSNLVMQINKYPEVVRKLRDVDFHSTGEVTYCKWEPVTTHRRPVGKFEANKYYETKNDNPCMGGGRSMNYACNKPGPTREEMMAKLIPTETWSQQESEIHHRLGTQSTQGPQCIWTEFNELQQILDA